MSDQTAFQITPVGAAYVEALPNRKKAKAIERAFKQHGLCPVSDLFDAAAITDFYARQGRRVAAVSRPGVKNQ